MYSRSKVVLNSILARGICTSGQRQQQPGLVKLKQLQAKYQCNDGKLIWQKGGFMDTVLYTSTWVLIWISMPIMFGMIYDMAKPTSWRTAEPAEEC